MDLLALLGLAMIFFAFVYVGDALSRAVVEFFKEHP
jgi:hypothetical protein